MKFNRYLLTLIVVPVLLFTAKSYAQNISQDLPARIALSARAFVVRDIAQNGSIIEITGVSDKTNLADIVQDLDLIYYPEDRLSIFPDLFMEMGGVITLQRAPKVTIYDGKKKTLYRSWAVNVSDLLSEKNIELGKDDKISPALASEVQEGSEIRINRVAKTTIMEKKPIEFKTTKKNDPNIDEGKTVVEKKGKNGEKELYFEVTREDGEEIARRLVDTKITSESETEILLVGTRPVITVACRFNSLVIAAATKNGVKANDLCYRMMKESRGNPSSDGGKYKGLFQYEEGFWNSVSAKAGYSGASIWDAESQIFVTAWAWSHGYRGRWPNP